MDLKVQMGAGTESGVACLCYVLTFINFISHAYQCLAEMPVSCRLSVLMVYIHANAVSAKVSCPCYDPAISRKDIVAINVSRLEVFEDGATVDIQALLDKKIIHSVRDGVKLLGGGELTKKLNVKVNAFSQTAKEKIEALGGTVEEV